MGEKIIADALDTVLSRHYEHLGNAEREKTAVVFMDRRWVAIQGDFIPDEIRDAVEYIKCLRLVKELKRSIEDISPPMVNGGQVYINDEFIENDVASANYSVKMNLNYSGQQHVEGIFNSNAFYTKTSLTDDVREALSEVANDGIRNALKPGDPLFGKC